MKRYNLGPVSKSLVLNILHSFIAYISKVFKFCKTSIFSTVDISLIAEKNNYEAMKV